MLPAAQELLSASHSHTSTPRNIQPKSDLVKHERKRRSFSPMSGVMRSGPVDYSAAALLIICSSLAFCPPSIYQPQLLPPPSHLSTPPTIDRPTDDCECNLKETASLFNELQGGEGVKLTEFIVPAALHGDSNVHLLMQILVRADNFFFSPVFFLQWENSLER